VPVVFEFDRYASRASRREFIAFMHAAVHFVVIRRTIHACRDPHDDKFLDVVVNGGADVLVTGDADLLVLNDFEGVPILTPSKWLTKIGV
jgi:putative PIN family toxin of toxin-antitoxin system